jgi:multicomponent Na+:H+ antiporter subunit G
MMNIFIGLFSTIGALAILFASIGILRMPDFYLRLSVTVKAATMGVGVLLICAAIVFPDAEVAAKATATIFFLLLTAPVAAHVIARTGYRSEISIWKDTWLDDLGSKYEKKEKKE